MNHELYVEILNSNVINFLIMVSILVVVFKKAKLGGLIDAISKEVENNVNLSAQSVQAAFKKYKETKRELKNTDLKKKEIIEGAKNSILKLNEKNKEIISNKETEFENNKEKLIQNRYERKVEKTVYDIKKAVFELSIQKIKEMSNENLQEKMIFAALDEFDKLEGVKNDN